MLGSCPLEGVFIILEHQRICLFRYENPHGSEDFIQWLIATTHDVEFADKICRNDHVCVSLEEETHHGVRRV